MVDRFFLTLTIFSVALTKFTSTLILSLKVGMPTKIIVFPAYKRLILSHGIAIVKGFFIIYLSNTKKRMSSVWTFSE